MSNPKSNNGEGSDLRSEQQKDTMWPTLGDSIPRSRGSSPQLKSGGERAKVVQEDRDTTSLEKLPSNTMNTVPPTYFAAVGVGNKEAQLKIIEEEGERIGVIPDDIMTEAKPLWTDLLAGKFPSKFPNLKDIFLTVNNIWSLGNRNIKIEVYKVTETLVKFRIPDKNTRERVLKRGMWSISGMPMILSKWAPIEELEGIETKIVPIWITMKNIPRSLFHWKGLNYIAKVVGKPIKLHPETIQCVKFDEAKILVEVDINAQLPKTHKYRSELRGMFSVEFLYPWVPRRCSKCFKWGHSADVCEEKNGENIPMERKEIMQNKKEEIHSEPEQSLPVQVTTESSSISLMKGNVEGSSSKVVHEDSTGKGSMSNASPEKTENKGSSSSNMKEGSYMKAVGKKVITVEEALEELRTVKEGLRQVSPYSTHRKHNQIVDNQEKLKSDDEASGKTENSGTVSPANEKEKLQKESDDAESAQERSWNTVSYGKSSKQKVEMDRREDFRMPLSPSRYEILAESVDEMDMMISNDGIYQAEDEENDREEEYDPQIEKMINEKTKAKTKEKEGKQNGNKGRGRGRKPKKQ